MHLRRSAVVTTSAINNINTNRNKTNLPTLAENLEMTFSSSSSLSSSSLSTVDSSSSSWHHQVWVPWKGKYEFFKTQLQMLVILTVAYLGDRFEPSYPRNNNHNMTAFWLMNLFLFFISAATWKHAASPKRSKDGNSNHATAAKKHPSFTQPLSRDQTEEWKGWMQFAFIMYHYYRAYSVYNYIRVFVSSYVWMTGFGNYLYFEKTKDFSWERSISMILRINYFPVLLCAFVQIPFELYYVVPLHTVGFFLTMMTCYFAQEILEAKFHWNFISSRCTAIGAMLVLHILFYESSCVGLLEYVFGKEISFRFQNDKYSAWIGILFGYLFKYILQYIQWAFYDKCPKNQEEEEDEEEGKIENDHEKENQNHWKTKYLPWIQRLVGFLLILSWYFLFGFQTHKETYNAMHPYVFVLPMFGFLMIRNSSKYLMECHSTVLEFLGKNTLETYVLQFHVFMNHSVQYIPILLPHSGSDGHWIMRFLNMIVCGTIFLLLSVWARKLTVSTQLTVVELWKLIRPKLTCSSRTTHPYDPKNDHDHSKDTVLAGKDYRSVPTDDSAIMDEDGDHPESKQEMIELIGNKN